MLRTLDIEASPAAEPLLEAVGILCSDGTARPNSFLRPNSKWSRLLRTQSDHRLWETAVLFHLRDAFRAGDVWLARSRRYGDIRKALLSAPAVADADHSPPVPASPHDWLAERRFALDEGLRRLAAAARAGAIAGGSIEDSVLRVERTEGAVPDGAADLVADLYRRMPDARITDILLEVDDATRFTEAFTHLRTGEPCRDRIGLLNVLLAEGINLGLRKMGRGHDHARVLGVDALEAWPAICWACSRVPPFDRYAVIPVARNVWQHVEAGSSPAPAARRLIIARTTRRCSARPVSRRPAGSTLWKSVAFGSSSSAAST